MRTWGKQYAGRKNRTLGKEPGSQVVKPPAKLSRTVAVFEPP